MSAAIEFYFDFSSPYAYLASEQIDALAQRHGRELVLRPVLLGAAFRVSGQRPLTEVPLKGEYSRRDFARSARHAGIAFAMPEPFPISTVQAARAFLVLQETGDVALLHRYFHAAYRAYFVHGRDISDSSILAQVLEECGAPAASVLEACAQPRTKEALKLAVDAALARGVFGAPYMIVDGEPFWGADRLPQLERWLSSGPF